jgi:hypothetical protein
MQTVASEYERGRESRKSGPDDRDVQLCHASR